MIGILREVTDRNEIYGTLTVHNIPAKVVQEKIHEIKQSLKDEGIYEWNIADVLDRFPDSWDWIYEPDVEDLEI